MRGRLRLQIGDLIGPHGSGNEDLREGGRSDESREKHGRDDEPAAHSCRVTPPSVRTGRETRWVENLAAEAGLLQTRSDVVPGQRGVGPEIVTEWGGSRPLSSGRLHRGRPRYPLRGAWRHLPRATAVLGGGRVVRARGAGPRRPAGRRTGGGVQAVPRALRRWPTAAARRGHRAVAHLGRRLARVPVPQPLAQRHRGERRAHRPGPAAARDRRRPDVHGHRHRQVRRSAVGVQPAPPCRLPQPHPHRAPAGGGLPPDGDVRLSERRGPAQRRHPVRVPHPHPRRARSRSTP